MLKRSKSSKSHKDLESDLESLQSNTPWTEPLKKIQTAVKNFNPNGDPNSEEYQTASQNFAKALGEMLICKDIPDDFYIINGEIDTIDEQLNDKYGKIDQLVGDANLGKFEFLP